MSKKIDARKEIGKVAIGFSYFNCVKEIPRALDPLVDHVDYIIGIDGRYINYEHEQDYSVDGSTELLQERYKDKIVLDKCKPMFQPDKRQKYLDIAGELKCDWLIVWDSDDILYPSPECQRWDIFYKNLRRYSKKFSDYRIFKMKSWIPDDNVWRKAYNCKNASNSWVPYIRIHKDPGTMRYCLDCHYWWSPKDATDEDLIMQRRGMFIADQTIDGVRLTTNSFLRGEAQLDTRDNWAWNNICEEQRRLYIKQNAILYTGKSPEWMPTQLDGYYRYDKDGRPISKICEEDGTLIKPSTPQNES